MTEKTRVDSIEKKPRERKKLRKPGQLSVGKFHLSTPMRRLLRVNAARLGWTESRLINYALRRAFSDVQRLEQIHATDFVVDLIERRLGKRTDRKKKEALKQKLSDISIRKEDMKAFSARRSLYVDSNHPPQRDLDDQGVWSKSVYEDIEYWIDQFDSRSGYHIREPEQERQRIRSLLKVALEKAKLELVEFGKMTKSPRFIDPQPILDEVFSKLDRGPKSAEQEAKYEEFKNGFQMATVRNE